MVVMSHSYSFSWSCNKAFQITVDLKLISVFQFSELNNSVLISLTV